MLISRILVSALLCHAVVAQQQDVRSNPEFSFGVLADVQYADQATAGLRHYRSSLDRLKECVDDLNQRDLAFVIQHGDFIDAGRDSFDAVLPVWRRLKAPRRNVIGNHDLPFLREQLLAKLKMPRGGYYDFVVCGWRFVVLDGMDISLHGYPRGHAKRRQATRMLAALKAKKVKNAQQWNGGIGKEQLDWLRATLSDATQKGQRAILHCHFPILAKASSDYHLLWNHSEVLELIEGYPCVAAWFNGHDHAGGYAQKSGIHHVTFAGMVEAPKDNAYAIADVFADRLVIRGIGKQQTLELKLRAPPESKLRKPPNILWISCEDISPHLGCYGDAYAVTPNLDALAKQGVLYEQAFATIGVCAPARSTIITGMYPPSIGTHHMRCTGLLPKDVRCFPELLREAGYYCTNNSKTDYNFKHGKNVWDASSRRAHWRNRKDGQPFFAVFNLTICHESKIRLGEKQYARQTKDFTSAERHDPAKATVPPYHPNTPEVRKDWSRYADMITLMDKRAGRILKELEDAGLDDDTIVIFFSDHGAGMPRSKRWLYDSSLRVPMIVRFPERYRTLASDDNAGKPGSRTSRLVSFVDFAPTMLSLAGVRVPAIMQGKAFLGETAAPPRKFVYGFRDRMDERYDMIRCVRGPRFKYIYNFMPHRVYAQYLDYMYQMPTMRVWQRMFDEGKLRGPQRAFFLTKSREELYDTQADPHEVKNLAANPAHAKRLERMREELVGWMSKIVDLGLLPEADLRSRFGKEPPFDAVRENPSTYPFNKILETAMWGGPGGRGAKDPAIRYWFAMRCLADYRLYHGAFAGNLLETVHNGLRTTLKDEAPDVRVASAEALFRYGRPAGALDVLVDALDHKSEWVRLRAINVLDRLDDKAHAAKPALQKATKDKNKYVMRVAQKALRDLGR